MRKILLVAALVVAVILVGSFSVNGENAQATVVVDPEVAFFNHAWVSVRPGEEPPPHDCYYLPTNDTDPDCEAATGVEAGDLGFRDSSPYVTGVYCRAWNSSGGDVWALVWDITNEGDGIGYKLEIWAERSDSSWYIAGDVVFHHLDESTMPYGENDWILCSDNAYIGHTYNDGANSHVHNELIGTTGQTWSDGYDDEDYYFGSSEWTFTIE
jgi:hypothetical protein